MPQTLLILAVLVHAVSFVLMLRQIEPFYTFFYSIAWWSFIVVVASANQLIASNSLLYGGSNLIRLLLFSNLSWLFFEVLNFRLNNWHYYGVPEEIGLRWPGYLVAFATVFPGLFETERLLRNLGFTAKWRIRGTGYLAREFELTFSIGLIALVLTLAAPRWFFPLAWLAVIFLLDPVLARLNSGDSLLKRMAVGDTGLMLRLLLAGLICGFLWEFWNFWSGSKWTYTIPYFDFARIFEMPLLGFLGFPPFALECYLMNRCLREVSERLWSRSPLLALAALSAAVVFMGIVLLGIDRFTVLDFRQVLQ